MEISTAHIFYIPVIFFVGVLVGYFVGRRAYEAELREKRRRAGRRKGLRGERPPADEASA